MATREAILRAALERIGATNGVAVNENIEGDARECVACGHYVDRCAVQSCEGHMARAALEAADKAPGLADDQRLIAALAADLNGGREFEDDDYRGEYLDAARETLAVIDAYQREPSGKAGGLK